MWVRAKPGSIVGFDRLWAWAGGDKSSELTNANKIDAGKAFWPTTLDKECDKAARILRSFCKDGFLESNDSPQLPSSLFGSNRSLTPESVDTEAIHTTRRLSHRFYKRIPTSVIQSAKALAIFTTMRTGLWVSGAGGSGVLVARLPDGSWSPPSAIMLHTEGVGFLVGVDLYDCVVVINTVAALAAFCQPRCTVGTDLDAVIGPLGTAGTLQEDVVQVDFNVPILTYVKSKGASANVSLDGTVVVERIDENDRFYGRRITIGEILTGRVPKFTAETSRNRLFHTLKAAQGDSDVDPSMVPVESAPSDIDLANGTTFGVPNKVDPDPYGFLALEKEGFVVREAGTLKHASRESFQFLPAASSPLFNSFNIKRDSVEISMSRRSSWKTAVTEKSSQALDMSTHVGNSPLPISRPSSALASVVNLAHVEDEPGHYFEESEEPLSIGFSAALLRLDSPRPLSALQSPPNDVPIISINSEPPPLRDLHISLLSPSKDAEYNIPTPTPQSTNESNRESYNLPTPKPQKMEQRQSDSNLSILSSPLPQLEVPSQTELSDADDEDDDEGIDSDDEVVFHDVIQAASIQAASPQPISKARLVTVIKPFVPPPPLLPVRNPNRLTQSTVESVGTVQSGVDTHKDLSWPASEERRPSSSQTSSVYSLRLKDVDTSVEPSLGSASSMDGTTGVNKTHETLQNVLNEASNAESTPAQLSLDDLPLNHPPLAVPSETAKGL